MDEFDMSNLPTVICHLGAHKTATSLIQKYFQEKREQYAALGVRYIPRERISELTGWGTRLIDNPGDFRAEIDSHAKHAGTRYVVFSYEDMLRRPFVEGKGSLYPRHRDPLNALSSALTGYNLKLVYYIRPQVEFVPSYYVQLIQEGGFFTFEQFLDELIDLNRLSWKPLVDGFVKVFGSDNIYIGDFRTIKGGQFQFLKEFVESTMPGIAGDYEYRKVHNVGLSARGLHIALRINPLLRKDTKTRETRKVRNFLQENFSSATEPKPVLLSEEVRAKLMAYGAEYDELIANYGLTRTGRP